MRNITERRERTMQITTHEANEFGRAAQAMYSRGANDLGHLLSAVAAKRVIPTDQYDRAAAAYRAWLVFDEPKAPVPSPRYVFDRDAMGMQTLRWVGED